MLNYPSTSTAQSHSLARAWLFDDEDEDISDFDNSCGLMLKYILKIYTYRFFLIFKWLIEEGLTRFYM